MTTDSPVKCDIRGCAGVGSHRFFACDANLRVMEQIDICDRHALILQIEGQKGGGSDETV